VAAKQPTLLVECRRAVPLILEEQVRRRVRHRAHATAKWRILHSDEHAHEERKDAQRAREVGLLQEHYGGSAPADGLKGEHDSAVVQQHEQDLAARAWP